MKKHHSRSVTGGTLKGHHACLAPSSGGPFGLVITDQGSRGRDVRWYRWSEKVTAQRRAPHACPTFAGNRSHCHHTRALRVLVTPNSGLQSNSKTVRVDYGFHTDPFLFPSPPKYMHNSLKMSHTRRPFTRQTYDTFVHNNKTELKYCTA